MLQHRDMDAFLITGKNSGTHWLKFMLNCAIARQYGVVAPAHASGRASDAIVGHPRGPRPAGVPRIGSSHTIPSIAFSSRWRLFDHSPVVVLVRHPRDAMLSAYVKWRHRNGQSLAEFVAGDPSGRRNVADIWWYIHFFNRWGDVARARPAGTLVVHYEDLQADPALWLPRVARHLGVMLERAAVQAGVAFAEREALADRLDPAFHETIIPDRAQREAVAFSDADAAAFNAILARHLRHSLGYDLPTRSAVTLAAGPPPQGVIAAAGR